MDSTNAARIRCCWRCRCRRALPALPFMLRFDILAMVHMMKSLYSGENESLSSNVAE